MTLTQAKATIWPFKGMNRPIGILLGENQIALRDLAWATENAYDDHIKQAARTILLSQLLGPRLKEPPRPLKVISIGRSYSERQVNLRIALSSLVAGVLGLLWLELLSLSLLGVISQITHSPKPPLMGAIECVLLIVLFGPGYLAYWQIKRMIEEAEQFQQGTAGEKRVVDLLRVSLPAPWTLIQSMEFVERRWGDIDLVLIGPGGIWAIEVKAYTGPTRNVGDRWQYKGRWGWRNRSKHPGRQARRNAVNLKGYLETKGVDVRWVNALVIWAGEEEVLTLQDPEVPVWKLSEISDCLEEFWRRQPLSEAQIQQCVAVLNEALEQVKKKETGGKGNKKI